MKKILADRPYADEYDAVIEHQDSHHGNPDNVRIVFEGRDIVKVWCNKNTKK
jgi:hypothetical protein